MEVSRSKCRAPLGFDNYENAVPENACKEVLVTRSCRWKAIARIAPTSELYRSPANSYTYKEGCWHYRTKMAGAAF